ncbi:DMT family transporter [Methylosinus sp. H3A]|uniref:DMT family transporter n=1 Tax=Methylosinus sp. H3A TaxID=2785786 RepID=UPI0018C286EC|nr:DMT family transporter [Methylosinus sp. H3A]MBG0807881.1 DMT family transporter [Methylosinus sp. H3A]
MKAPAPASLKGFFCLVSTGGLVGVTIVIAGLAIRSGWHPIAFLLWSALGGGLVLVAVACATAERLKLSAALLRYGLLSGLLSFALPNMLSFLSIPHVGAGFVSLCLAFPPLLTYGLAVPLRLDRFSTKGAAGMTLGLGGAALLAASRPGGVDGGWIWTGIALTVPVIVATGNIYRTVDWPGNASPRLLAPIMLLAAAAITGVYAVFTDIPLNPETWDESASALLAAQMTIIAATYALFFALQKHSGPIGVSQIGWISAGAGKLLAVAFLGEAFPAILPFAFLFILAGVVLVSRRAR